MIPTAEERDALFKAFGRAFFKQDLEAMYQVVTEAFTYSILVGEQPRVMNTRDQVAAFFEERKGIQKNVRFEDVVFHHAPEATFMTYRVTGTDVASGEPFERVGVERYTFRDGRIAEKDVYSRPLLQVAACSSALRAVNGFDGSPLPAADVRENLPQRR